MNTQTALPAGLVHHPSIPFPVPAEAAEILSAAPSVIFAGSTEELIKLAMRDAVDGWQEVAYEVEGKGRVVEARVCQTRNGINANYLEPYMRRRDPDCMVIGDELPSDKDRYVDRFGKSFDPLRAETMEWLKTQPLAVFAFHAGLDGKGTHAFVIAPDNARIDHSHLGAHRRCARPAMPKPTRGNSPHVDSQCGKWTGGRPRP